MSYLKNVVKMNPSSDMYAVKVDLSRYICYRGQLRILLREVMGAAEEDDVRWAHFVRSGQDTSTFSDDEGMAVVMGTVTEPLFPWINRLNPFKWVELSLGFLSLTVAALAAWFPKPIAYLLNAILGAPFALARGIVGIISSPMRTWIKPLAGVVREHPIGFAVTLVLSLAVTAFVAATILTGGALFGIPFIAAAVAGPLFAGLTAASSAIIGALGATGLAATIGLGVMAVGVTVLMGLGALIVLDQIRGNLQGDDASVVSDLGDALYDVDIALDEARQAITDRLPSSSNATPASLLESAEVTPPIIDPEQGSFAAILQEYDELVQSNDYDVQHPSADNIEAADQKNYYDALITLKGQLASDSLSKCSDYDHDKAQDVQAGIDSWIEKLEQSHPNIASLEAPTPSK